MTQDSGRPRPDSVGSYVTPQGLQELEGRLLLSASPFDADEPQLYESTDASQAEVTAQGTSPYLLGIDVSQFQGSINWGSVAASGREFAFIRALDRDGDLDTRFLNNIVGAKNAGIWAGAYQFVTPWTDGYNDAVYEARLFANTIAPYLTEDYLRPVIDIEAGPPHEPYPLDLDNTVLTNWVHDYMAEFERLTGIQPLIYTNTNHAVNAFTPGVNVYDLWLANWTNDPDSPPGGNADGVWNGYDFWQYSGGGDTVPGIAGGVDGDVYFGSVAEMVAAYGIVLPDDDHGDAYPLATPVAMPSTTVGELETFFDTDWFSFALAGGTDYTFSVIAGSLGTAELSLYSSTGTLITSSTGPASGGALTELNFSAVVGDTYHLKVSTVDDAGTYGLAIQETDDHGDAIAEASELASLAIGGLQSGTDQDYYHFTAAAGMQYDLSVLSVGLPDAVLTLYDAGGQVIVQDSGASPASPLAALSWTATAGGEMYVAVSSNNQSLGDYAVTLSESDPVLEGDLDSDGFVGISDLNIVLGNWNQNVTPGDLLSGDPDGDGFVGIGDLNKVLGNWNAGSAPPVTAIATSTSADDMMSQPDADFSTPATEAQVAVSQNQSVGLAIRNWQAGARSAFGDKADGLYAPAIGLWEEGEPA